MRNSEIESFLQSLVTAISLAAYYLETVKPGERSLSDLILDAFLVAPLILPTVVLACCARLSEMLREGKSV